MQPPHHAQASAPAAAGSSSAYVPDPERLRWIEEGTYEVAPGVHRIPLPLPTDGLRAVNTYAIESGDGLVMIDSGWALEESRETLERSLARIGAGLGDIRRFLVTHIHRDHYTQAIAVRRIFGTTVAVGEDERASLEVTLGADPHTMAARGQRLVMAGAAALIQKMSEAGMRPPDGRADYEYPDEWIAAGQKFEVGGRTLEAIPTPGHTHGHVVFADYANGLLFAGDHVLPHITPSISLEPAPQELPLGDFLDSLRLVRQLPDLRLLPAHGPVTPSVHVRVDELLDHHAQRLAIMSAELAGGPRTAYEVALAIKWTSRGRALLDLDLLNQTLAVGETQAHLDLLVARGQAAAAMDNGVKLYRLSAATL
jgi:glyoxylase-like metal-dependent hydrolase (beta-lactamase superfamily II)